MSAKDTQKQTFPGASVIAFHLSYNSYWLDFKTHVSILVYTKVAEPVIEVEPNQMS